MKYLKIRTRFLFIFILSLPKLFASDIESEHSQSESSSEEEDFGVKCKVFLQESVKKLFKSQKTKSTYLSLIDDPPDSDVKPLQLSKKSPKNEITEEQIISEWKRTLKLVDDEDLLQEELDLVEIYSAVNFILDGLVEENLIAKRSNSGKNSIFNNSKKPDIDLSEYIHLFKEVFKFPSQVMICTLIYIDRLIKNTGIIIEELNVHIVFFVSLTIAHKYVEDNTFKNIDLAKIGGLTNKDLNQLEAEFLSEIGYELYVTEQLYAQYLRETIKCGRRIRNLSINKLPCSIVERRAVKAWYKCVHTKGPTPQVVKPG